MEFDSGPFIFRMNDNGAGPNLLLQVCVERGWREFTHEPLRDAWNLWWRSNGFPLNHYKQLKGWQFTNHIPKGSAICRKDNLVRYLRCMRKVYGSIYDFSPEGYNLPREYTKLVAECGRHRQLNENKVWICKPVSQSQGRGIFLFRKLSDLCYDNSAVVQRYVESPLLIGGYKFDLRLYVCVPSYHPLVVYLYSEGLARFATDKFSLADLDNPFRHLTNTSLNKLGPGYAAHKDRVGSGCKWTLKQLRSYLQQVGVNDWLLWQRVSALVVLTVLSQTQSVPTTANCFEFYGFDVLVDADLRPWLLEVNLSPALGNDCDADAAVKKPMLHDMFDLLGLPVCNTGLSLFTVWTPPTSPGGAATAGVDVDAGGETPPQQQADAEKAARASAQKWRRKQSVLSHVNLNAQARSGEDWVRFHPAAIAQQEERTRVGSRAGVRPDTGMDDTNTPPWGNGRDWLKPPLSEGGWTRVYPMLASKEKGKDKSAKEKSEKVVVSAVHRYAKAAREIARKCPTLSDEAANDALRQSLGLSGTIWLPKK